MSRAQRLSFLAVAVTIAVVAVVILASGGDDEEPAQTSSGAAPTATATPTEEGTAEAAETPTPTPRPKPPLLQAGKVTNLRFEEGDRVRFRVASPGGDEIHVHGYDVTKQIPAGRTTTVSFPADITGIFEIEFHGTGEQIGQLRVDPD